MRTFILSLLFTLFAISTNGASPVQVRLHPYGFIGSSKPTVTVFTHIDRDVKNREALLWFGSDGQEWNSGWELEGENAAVYREFKYSDLSPGVYKAVLYVRQVGDKILKAESQTVTVLEQAPSSPF